MFSEVSLQNILPVFLPNIWQSKIEHFTPMLRKKLHSWQNITTVKALIKVFQGLKRELRCFTRSSFRLLIILYFLYIEVWVTICTISVWNPEFTQSTQLWIWSQNISKLLSKFNRKINDFFIPKWIGINTYFKVQCLVSFLVLCDAGRHLLL